MRVKDRRRRFVFGVDLHLLAEGIWAAMDTGKPMPEIQWWMSSGDRPYGLAWSDDQLIRICIPWSRPHLVLVAELILHELCHCALPSTVEDHGPEFRALLTATADDLWGIEPFPEDEIAGRESDPEYDLDRRLETAMMVAYYEGSLEFDGDEGEKPETCRRCGMAYGGPTRCCGRPTKPLL